MVEGWVAAVVDEEAATGFVSAETLSTGMNRNRTQTYPSNIMNFLEIEAQLTCA